MSEWCDRQKKPNSYFRKLLQERIYKANPRRDVLTKEEQVEKKVLVPMRDGIVWLGILLIQSSQEIQKKQSF
jgi:hypothetical protein